MSGRTSVLTAVALLVACGGGAPVSSSAPTSPPAPTPVSVASATPAPNPNNAFRVALLLSAARSPSNADVTRVFTKANELLGLKTGESMVLTETAVVGTGNPVAYAVAYVNAHASNPPDGVIVLTDDPQATLPGGYSVSITRPAGTQNRFPSPVVGDGRVYVAAIDFFHMYSRCGYDDAGNRIGTVSANGECRNRAGIACVDNGRYWTCPDTLGDLYAQPDYFIGATIVHEFLHPFGSEGALDHWGAPPCVNRGGMSAADATNSPLAQQNYGMCPDLYPRFRHR